MLYKIPTVAPPIVTYSGTTHNLSLVEQYFFTEARNSYLNWCLLQFTNLYFLQPWNVQPNNGNFDDIFGKCYNIGKCDILVRDFYDIQYLNKTCSEISEFVRERLADGFAVRTYVDRYFLIPTLFSETNYHDVFITGYDSEDDSFLITDFFHRNYETIKIKSNNLNMAFDSYAKLQYNQRFDVLKRSLIACRIYNSLAERKEYLNIPFDSSSFLLIIERYLSGIIYNDRQYGYRCYDLLMKYISDLSISSENIDIRVFHLLYSHKIMLYRSVNYLMESKIIKFDSLLLEQVKKLLDVSIINRNLLIKLNLSPDKTESVKVKICNNVKKMKEEEIEIYEILHKEISHYISV